MLYFSYILADAPVTWAPRSVAVQLRRMWPPYSWLGCHRQHVLKSTQVAAAQHKPVNWRASASHGAHARDRAAPAHPRVCRGEPRAVTRHSPLPCSSPLGTYGASNAIVNFSTWGGNAVYKDGEYHLFVARVPGTLATWYKTSQIDHAVQQFVLPSYQATVNCAIEISPFEF